MTDTHLRILRLVAEHSRRELSDHDAERTCTTSTTTSRARRRQIERAVTKSGAQVAKAEARRLQRAITEDEE